MCTCVHVARVNTVASRPHDRINLTSGRQGDQGQWDAPADGGSSRTWCSAHKGYESVSRVSPGQPVSLKRKPGEAQEPEDPGCVAVRGSEDLHRGSTPEPQIQPPSSAGSGGRPM